MTDWKTLLRPDGAGSAAALRIWEGGLGIWGAAALGAWVHGSGVAAREFRCPPSATRWRPASCWPRRSAGLGNYFNQELYGRETTVPWAWRSSTAVTPGVVDGALPRRGVDRAGGCGGPPHIPLRAVVEPAGLRLSALGGPQIPPRARPAVRALRMRPTAPAGSGSTDA